MKRSIFIGFDPGEFVAFALARFSLVRHMKRQIPVFGLLLPVMQELGLYNRPTEMYEGQLWDKISEAPMSTEHACSRFLVKELARDGWAMFCDGDVLFRKDVNFLFDQLDPKYAVYCVHHKYAPTSSVKKDGQMQTVYPRKNWSSVFVINCNHPANVALTVEIINKIPGRDLHRFCWLNDDEIGELNPEWNFLVGHTDQQIDPAIVHFTEGLPNVSGYENVQYADEWWRELRMWAIGTWASEIKSSPPASRAAHLRAGNGSLSVMAGAYIGTTTRR
jgi:hypothetical protein